jgi:uncharacterized protein HemY
LRNEVREAENCFWKAYTLRPDFSALAGLTEALLQSNQLGEAERRAREGIQLRPRLWAAESLMGRVYLATARQGSKKKAKVCFERARRFNPRAEEPLMFLADLLYSENKLEAAQEVRLGLSFACSPPAPPPASLSHAVVGMWQSRGCISLSLCCLLSPRGLPGIVCARDMARQGDMEGGRPRTDHSLTPTPALPRSPSS